MLNEAFRVASEVVKAKTRIGRFALVRSTTKCPNHWVRLCGDFGYTFQRNSIHASTSHNLFDLCFHLHHSSPERVRNSSAKSIFPVSALNCLIQTRAPLFARRRHKHTLDDFRCARSYGLGLINDHNGYWIKWRRRRNSFWPNGWRTSSSVCDVICWTSAHTSIPNDEAFMITISTKIPDINKHIEC